MRLCGLEDCGNRHLAVGMCTKHYRRFTSHGTTCTPFIRRLMTRVTFTSDCWLWDGYRAPDGYGRISKDGRKVLAHRAMYELQIGPVPDGLELDHLCRNPSCCNPEHLEPVTHRENVIRGRAGYAPDDRCKHGHDLNDPVNVYRHTRGRNGRKCKPCALRRSRERAQARERA